MKKIGIITTYYASNYGAMLQPFALKRVLEQLGHNVEMVRYKQPHIANWYNPFYIKKLVNPWFRPRIGYMMAVLPVSGKRELAFRRFMRKYVCRKSGFEKEIPQDKQIYIVGSDQLWRKFDNKFDDVFWGHFKVNDDAKKVAYAVSGEMMDFSKESIDYMKNSFKNFNLISMREDEIANNYKRHLGFADIDVVLDPTLLANREIYKEIPIVNPHVNNKYVFFYYIRGKSVDFIDKIYNFAKTKGLDVVVMTEAYDTGLDAKLKEYKGIYYARTSGIEEFLGAINNAEYIFTPSFHGAAFSIIFHKKFYSLMLNDGCDTRPRDLLSKLDLKSLCISKDDRIIETEINYASVESKLSVLREHSMSFLNKALNL